MAISKSFESKGEGGPVDRDAVASLSSHFGNLQIVDDASTADADHDQPNCVQGGRTTSCSESSDPSGSCDNLPRDNKLAHEVYDDFDYQEDEVWSDADSNDSSYFLDDDILFSDDGPLYVVRDYFLADAGIATRTQPPSADRVIFSIHFSVHMSSPGIRDLSDRVNDTAIQALADVLINSNGEAIAPFLSSLEVPEDHHPLILERIVNTANTMLADPRHALRQIFSMHVFISDGEPAVEQAIAPPEWEATPTDTREVTREEENYSYGIPATESSIKALKRISSERPCDGQSKCSICMEEYELVEMEMNLTEMPCSHVFHCDCIEKWLQTSHMCPLCRYQLPCIEADSGDLFP
ncbi:uncharacterized protein LOC116200352 [Punica granatum]|uniref:RING-type E3 ubiquitin transferase n=2 Tax=Punica granatum TaxID=22663 RepID=A0A218X985_PUNGR|nr:uncharacterized protein LOC116200352 [Punica granatum]OWM81785.1 hypothetical protein CDL15_Pgr007823 [Punica granatum]PKI43438.1 hypothetical protein CRG98_036195 [Punica granatum]